MQVTMFDYTGCGAPDPARHAANVLVFTKSTRLAMKPSLFAEIESWPWEKVEAELEYMANTIPSSWEFIQYNFMINDVTRGFTHQFVRTRTAGYAQQTMRVLDVGGWTYGTGPTIDDDLVLNGHDGSIEGVGPSAKLYHDTMATISAAYDELIENGIAIEDARGVLPTNIHTNICSTMSLRTITDLVRKRSSSRTQGEYGKVLEAIKEAVIEVHPWAKLFIDRDFDTAAKELENKILDLKLTLGLDHVDATNMVKLIDQMRKG